MNETRSDALVFFGATGDLAYKKIFPSLQAMVKRGNLNVPVIGVAKAGWNLDQSSRAREGQHGEARRRDRRRPSKSCAACCATWTATTRTGDVSSAFGRSSARAKRPAHYLAIPPVTVRDGGAATAASRGAPRNGARVIVEKPFGARSGLGAES